MDLKDEEIQHLAEVLSQHLTGFAVRRATVEEAGLGEVDVAGDPKRAWRSIIVAALEQGRLRHLLEAAVRVSPGDDQLDRLAEGAGRGELVLPEPEPEANPMWPTLALGALGALAMVGVAVVGAMFMRGELPPEPGDEAGPEVEVEVRRGLMEQPHPVVAPRTAPAPEPATDTGEGTDTDVPTPPPSGKYIRIPEPEQPPE